DLLRALPVGGKRGRKLADFDAKLQASLFRHRGELAFEGTRELAHLNVADLDVQLAGLHLGEVQAVLDEREQLPPAGTDDARAFWRSRASDFSSNSSFAAWSSSACCCNCSAIVSAALFFATSSVFATSSSSACACASSLSRCDSASSCSVFSRLFSPSMRTPR